MWVTSRKGPGSSSTDGAGSPGHQPQQTGEKLGSSVEKGPGTPCCKGCKSPLGERVVMRRAWPSGVGGEGPAEDTAEGSPGAFRVHTSPQDGPASVLCVRRSSGNSRAVETALGGEGAVGRGQDVSVKWEAPAQADSCVNTCLSFAQECCAQSHLHRVFFFCL